MTIHEQIAKIKEHPFYAEALRDEAALSRLLFEVMFHTYTVASWNAYRGYRKASAAGLNRPQIIEAIRDCEPPTNLDLRMPIPQITCVVVELKNAALISGAAHEQEEG